ncbi:nuclear transport factor 2 family protein [Candidatus Poribacteria bacterium]|jgi:hypothetical protein|nr:nuclear transport factor 2 family protein [Candidatus Poribacteria bacterium]MBT5535196.1 nuclear transport factor 2 family protein [Candidatus Poribacteria bacterium]MBT5712733.1 nuclear transport factor 2 family protein [Candidatus Poribacteria bacterium]MBT7098676.1 nuclear transport factor 2 family protein [Candidatus Poribacteria bacterium]MBT7806806.1 nuclear transport factor 2 family protein [Candidatus Poribacteria bacterium]
MRTFVWLFVGLAAGLVVAFTVQRALPTPDAAPESASEDIADATEGPARIVGDAVAPASTRREAPLVITDVYTTDEAAQRALDEREAMARVAEVIFSSDAERPEAAIQTSGTTAGLFASDAGVDTGPGQQDTSATLPGPDEAPVDPVTAALQQEVTRVVEGFLRDAVEGRDVQAYLTALDEDFRYTFDGGTPADDIDDVVYEGDDYRDMVVGELFEQFPVADVTLSDPYELVLRGADAATVEYDYDMSLRGPGNSRDLAGSASFLLMRGGTRGDTDAWRIVDWVDSPPRSREP